MIDKKTKLTIAVVTAKELQVYGHQIPRVHAAAFRTGEKGAIRYRG